LVTHDGHALGTFCVIDNKPRTGFTPAQQQVLKDLADTVIDSFEMNNAMRNAQAYRLQMEREMKKRLRAMTGGGGY
jgi:GAF domain-containing protein